MTVHVFHGPTIGATAVRGILPNARLHPPVRHGDLLRLAAVPGDVVVIIDGLFHHVASVRHKEILELMGNGVAVVGASSMGALRAAELYPYGMVGIGEIYQAYRDGLIEADDEVTVVHTSNGDAQVSEALVDIRGKVRRATVSGLLSEEHAESVMAYACRLHYTERSWTALRRAVIHEQPELASVVDQLSGRQRNCGSVSENRKYADAVAALRHVADGEVTPPSAAWRTDDSWRTFALRHWIARYRGEWIDRTHVPFLAVLQHQQIYDPAFAGRWRTYALRWIAKKASVRGTDVETEALAVAASRGIALRHLHAEQIAHWLTPAERGALTEREQLLRLLVRSAGIDHPISYAEAGDLLDHSLSSARIVAAAFVHNGRVADSGPRRTVYHLRTDRLRAHLAEQWAVPATDTAALTAAAQDRGFSGIEGAIEVVRSFYLWATQ
jgi:hypothetical protein